MDSLNQRVVLVTGAAQGLGRATALAVAREGANLVLTDIDEGLLAQTAADVKTLGRQAIYVAGDIGEPATHERIVTTALSEFGQIDGLCNVAGVLGPGTLADATSERFDRVMHVNCLAQLLMIQRCSDALRASGRGAIVNVASVGALVALPLMSIYCASKAAVLGMTRAVAAELAPHIRCNVVCPGGIDTPMSQRLLDGVPEGDREALLGQLTGRQLIKRFASADEIAQTIVYLLGDGSSFLTGTVISADGGHTAW